MEKYKFDWDEVIYGTIQFEAQNGTDAENQFMEMPVKELLKNSIIGSDKIDRQIRFVTVGKFFESMTLEEWYQYKKYI